MIKNQKHDFTSHNERLQTIIDNILDLIIEMDLNGNFTYISPQSFQILGYTPEELTGRKAIEIILPDDLKSFINMMRPPVQYNKSHSFNLRLKHKNGNIIYISAKGVIFNQNDETKHIIVIRDISHEVLAERKVKESEQHYRKVIESIGDPIQVIDNDLKIILANTTFKEWINLYGINSEVIGKTPFEIFPFLPNDVADEYKYVFESGQNLTKEECIDLDGNSIYVETRKIPILTNGKVTQIITVLRDITEKKKSSQYFEESEEKFRNISNQSFMSMAIIQDGLIKYWNKRVMEINGYSSEEIQNWKPYEFLKMIHPDDKEFVLNQAKKKEAGDKNVIEQYKYRLLRKTGEIRWIELFSKSINYRGKPAILAMSIEITDKMIAEQKLQESEEKYRNLFEDSPYMIFLVDLRGNILDLNQTALESVSYTKEELIGENFSTFDIMRNKNLSSLAEMFKKVLIDEYLDPFEIHVNSPKIKPDWMKIQAKIVYIGEKKHIQVIVEDISEKKEAEKMLKESEKKFQNIIENTKDAIVIIDLNGKLQYVSPQLSIILKLKEKKIKETSDFFKYVHEEDVQEITSFFKKTILEKSSPDKVLEFRILDNQKNYIWLASTSKNYYDDNGNIIGFITSIKDITDKKIAQQRLRESEYQYRHLFENSPNAIVVTDSTGIVLDQNNAVEKIFGIPRHEAIGKNFHSFDIFEPEQISIIKTRTKKMFNGIIQKPISLKAKNRVGNKLWILLQNSIINIGDKIIIESIIQDITERIKAEEIIKTENKRLLELNKMKTDLITRVSHELKTPLNSVYGGAQILLNLYGKTASSDALEFIEMIYKGGERLKLLIENILDISRIEHHKLTLKLHEENLVEVIKECIEDLAYLLNERDLDITLTLPKENFIKIDKIRIEQVLVNILTNAIKNTPPNGVIEVILEENEEFVCLSVKDNGVGLTLDDMGQLFKQFGKIERYGQQLDVDIEGSGLGLFISKEIIDLHKGTIWAESEGRNKGATFKIKLHKNIN
ncbi:MAG: PAS domain S-box protein [Candidatus Lokiarchaeota archaeon]|nr:PAS domain S-box protein [Candidatus Lokiarchaeota archaeon]